MSKRLQCLRDPWKSPVTFDPNRCIHSGSASAGCLKSSMSVATVGEHRAGGCAQ